MLFRRKKEMVQTWDALHKKPVIVVSICTGEETAGFHNLKDGTFEPVMAIHSEDDLAAFCRQYGITKPLEREY